MRKPVDAGSTAFIGLDKGIQKRHLLNVRAAADGCTVQEVNILSLPQTPQQGKQTNLSQQQQQKQGNQIKNLSCYLAKNDNINN